MGRESNAGSTWGGDEVIDYTTRVPGDIDRVAPVNIHHKDIGVAVAIGEKGDRVYRPRARNLRGHNFGFLTGNQVQGKPC